MTTAQTEHSRQARAATARRFRATFLLWAFSAALPLASTAGAPTDGPTPRGTVCPLAVDPTNVLDAGGSFIGNSVLSDPSCDEVVITFAPGTYEERIGEPHAGIDIVGGGNTSDVRLVFEQSHDYYFNHELYLTGFDAAGRTLTIEGAGRDLTTLNFCQDPSSCECVDANMDPSDGCQLEHASWGMLHLRGGASNVVVRGLALASRKHEAEVVPAGEEVNEFAWEFTSGVMMCFDGSQCRDIVIEDAAIDRARYSVYSKNLEGLTLASSRLTEFEIAYLAACSGDCETPQRRLLVYGNEMLNLSRAGSKYGIFTTNTVESSAFVGNTIENVFERGINPRRGSRLLWIHDNTIRQVGAGSSGAGINLGQVGMADMLVSDNRILTVADTQPPAERLGGRPISLGDEVHHDPCSLSVNGTIRWPSGYWNGYGITTSGAVDGAIGLVGNTISDAATHGILIEPGADNVLVYDNDVSTSGINGLSIVTGFSLGGQYWYTPRGGSSNLWVQENRLLDNRRSGIEILPRIQPIFAVVCDETSPDCTHPHNPYPLCDIDTKACGVDPGTLPDIGIQLYDPSTCVNHCLDPECESSTAICGDYCYEPSWKSFQVDTHDNVLTGNGRVAAASKGESTALEIGANFLLDGLVGDVTGVDASYSISGMDADNTEPGWQNNFHLYVHPLAGGFVGADLGSLCFSHHEGAPRPRSQNTAVSKYRDLVAKVESCLEFPYHDPVQGWETVNVWNDVRFPTGDKDFDIAAPTTEDCQVPPPTSTCAPPPCGDWVVSSSCTFTGSAAAAADVEVRDGATLTVEAGAALDIDFAQHHLLVKAGSRVIVKAGGRIE